jgi:uncharacterized protein
MASLTQLEEATTTSMKAGDKDRTAALRMFISTAKMIAKNDGDREVTDDDVIVAGNRMIKQARETRSFMPPGDSRMVAIDNEIAVVQEFLPNKMSAPELEELIVSILSQSTCPEGKAARGFVMKTLNSAYRGEFEARDANEFISKVLTK